jgi:hypothetical protein
MKFPGQNWLVGSNTIYVVLAVTCISMTDHCCAQTSRITLPSEHEKALKESNLKVRESPDSMLHFSFPPVEIEGEYLFKDKHQQRKYHQLYEDIKRTYPLSQIVVTEIKLVDAELDSVYVTKSKQKAYLKWYEKHIYHTYIDTLKSLNLRQIRLCVKLTSRETGNSPYQLIKKYRGGWNAFLWQLSANALLVNLKTDYDPVEDAMIEDIIRKFY